MKYTKNSKIKRSAVFSVLILAMFMFTACGSADSVFHKEPVLSEIIVGEWYGQVDVAQMVYRDLGEELGMELSSEPVYCDMKMVFNEDGSCTFIIDVESFSIAVGKCVEPYTSAFFGFNTDFLVEIIMQSVAADIPADTGRTEGHYKVNDENDVVYINTNDGEVDTVCLGEDGCLQYEDNEVGQIIIFEKGEGAV